jgi:nucleotide-binding universal stress UspA family protein
MRAPAMTILLATDGSPSAAEAGRVALALAGLTGASVHLVHAWDVPTECDTLSTAPVDLMSAEIRGEERGRATLIRALDQLGRAGGRVTSAQLRRGRVAEAVVEEATRIEADLIVTGSRGGGQAKRVRLGSVAETIVRRAPCPVLVMRGSAHNWPPTRIVVGDDGSAEAWRAAELAARLVAPAPADFLLLRAVASLPPGGDPTAVGAGERAKRFQSTALRLALADLDRHAIAIAPTLGHRLEARATVEDAGISLLREAGQGAAPGLIAVGTRGTAPAGQLWLGSTALRVLTCATGPVLICPHRAIA